MAENGRTAPLVREVAEWAAVALVIATAAGAVLLIGLAGFVLVRLALRV